MFLSPAFQWAGYSLMCIPGDCVSPSTYRENPLSIYLWGQRGRAKDNPSLQENRSLSIEKCGPWTQLRGDSLHVCGHQRENTLGGPWNLRQWWGFGHCVNHQQHQPVLNQSQVSFFALLAEGEQIRLLRFRRNCLLFPLLTHKWSWWWYQHLHPRHRGGTQTEQ